MPYSVVLPLTAPRRWPNVVLCLALQGCFFASVKQRNTSFGPSPESVDLLGPRRVPRDAPKGTPGAFRIAVTGQGTAVQGSEGVRKSSSDTEWSGVEPTDLGRYVPAGSVKLVLAYEFNPYFEMGLIGGAACGKVVAEGTPADLDAVCLPSGALEFRGIFGSERVQVGVHLRLGVTSLAALGSYQLETDDGDDIGSYPESLHAAFSTSMALSLAWRITPRVAFVSALTLDALPYIESGDRFKPGCDSFSKCKRIAGEPRISRGLGVVPAIGVEVALSQSVRLRSLVAPAIFDETNTTASYLWLSGTLEWGTTPSPAKAPVTVPTDGARQ